MDSININGVTYYSEQVVSKQVKALTLATLKKALAELSDEVEPAAMKTELGEIKATDLDAIVREVKEVSIPSAALLANQCRFIGHDYLGQTVYLWMPQSMEYLVRTNPKRIEAINWAVGKLYGDGTVAHFISSITPMSAEHYRALMEVLRTKITQRTRNQRAAFIAWTHLNAEGKQWTYEDLARSAGIGKSAAYHSVHNLLKTGNVNLDKLSARGFTPDAEDGEEDAA